MHLYQKIRKTVLTKVQFLCLFSNFKYLREKMNTYSYVKKIKKYKNKYELQFGDRNIV